MNILAAITASGSKMPLGEAGISAVLGYVVVFFGLAQLLAVVWIVGKVMVAQTRKAAPAGDEAAADTVPAAQVHGSPGSAGELKLYGTSPREAAMIMAIVAEKTGRPLNELRFISIKEVK